MFSDNPIKDYLIYDAERSEGVLRCSDCGEPIYDDYYDICGEPICEDCILNYKRRVG